MNESTNSQKHHSSNHLKAENVQGIKNKIFSQVQTENEGLTRRVRKNDIELYRGSASTDNRGHHRIQNAAATGHFMTTKESSHWGW